MYRDPRRLLGSPEMCHACLSRCLRILALVQSQVGHNINQLARELGVSRRTIFRDLSALRNADVPIAYNLKRGRLTLRRRGGLALPPISADELIALLLAAHLGSPCLTKSLGNLAHQAIGKILALSSASTVQEATNLLESTAGRFPGAPDREGEEQICATIMNAIRQRRQIRVVYHPARAIGEPIRTKMTSCRMIAMEGGWQLIGRSSWHRGSCQIAVQQIEHAEQVNEDQGCPQLCHAAIDE